ncbi:MULTISPECIES: helix-turn-helix domain-containing protein [Roseateles]|uniref:AraC family transcriptional regulator n=1 Tax=Roseateles albus TaxID=2987525 RepID=A0ABT5KFW3_9BURK|nr:MULTISPECIES: AraC family transcriptional regulator [Roseateles]MCV2358147.1 AraC family transcriptional regulator [Paucibacter sp. TC2R-5]MDC8772444.1 AraC family transcriptional regulator [Roseateles albus]
MAAILRVARRGVLNESDMSEQAAGEFYTAAMSNSDLHPDTVARLLAPSLGLSGCVHAYIWRDTTRAAHLTEEQRSGWFPATPFCGLSWTIEGCGSQVLGEGALQALPSGGLIFGPRSSPVQFRSAAGARIFMVAILPESLHALTGLDLSLLVDRHGSIDALLGPDWQALNARLLAAEDEAQCQQIFEAFLLPRWRAHRDIGGPSPRRYRDWMQQLATRAVAAGHGASLRQVERRIKQWSGQSLRALRRVSRSEQTFFQVRRELEAGELVWSALAQDLGYADQAHLCRETRRVTGFSPDELRQRIETDEAFWAYRVWV